MKALEKISITLDFNILAQLMLKLGTTIQSTCANEGIETVTKVKDKIGTVLIVVCDHDLHQLNTIIY